MNQIKNLTLQQVIEQHEKLPNVDWCTLFDNHGFYKVYVRDLSSWNQLHAWCERHFERQKYTWTGSIFWFQEPQDALLMILRWG